MTPLDQWPTSLWVALGLAPFAATLLHGFVRESKSKSWFGIAAATAGHAAFLAWVPRVEPATTARPPAPKIELYDVPEAPEPETEPEPEPEPALETEPEPVPAERPKTRRQKPRRKDSKQPNQRPAPDAPASPEPPAGPKRFDMSQLNQGAASGVTVHSGSGGGSTLEGDPRNRGRGPRKGAAPQTTTAPSTGHGDRAWAPASQVFVQKLPVPRSVPKRQCPATKKGVEGTVFLKVQVRRDGSVRKVNVTRGIGHGCDELAAAALRKAKFKPALSDANKAVDFEIRYEYVFRLSH